MARLTDEPMIVLRSVLDKAFVLLLGTQMMSSGWSWTSDILASRSFFKGRGISLSPSGVWRIILVLLRAAAPDRSVNRVLKESLLRDQEGWLSEEDPEERKKHLRRSAARLHWPMMEVSLKSGVTDNKHVHSCLSTIA